MVTINQSNQTNKNCSKSLCVHNVICVTKFSAKHLSLYNIYYTGAQWSQKALMPSYNWQDLTQASHTDNQTFIHTRINWLTCKSCTYKTLVDSSIWNFLFLAPSFNLMIIMTARPKKRKQSQLILTEGFWGYMSNLKSLVGQSVSHWLSNTSLRYAGAFNK